MTDLAALQPAAGLGPVELYALLHPNAPGSPYLAQLVLARLLTEGALTLTRTSKKSLGMRYETVALHLTGRPAPGPGGAYAAALHALTARPVPPEGLEPTEVLIRLQRALGGAYGKMLSAHARPLLIERGLLAQEERTRLGLFRTLRHVYTAAGAEAHAALAAWVRRADQLPALLKVSEAGAAAEAAALGVAVLLSDRTRPYIGRLVKAARAQGLSNPTDVPALPDLEGFDMAMGWIGIDALSDMGSLGDAFGDMGASDGGGDGGH